MRFILSVFASSLLLSGCNAPKTETPEPPAPPDTGVVSPLERPVRSDIDSGDYIMKPVGELQLSGTESPKDIADLLKARFGAAEQVEGNYSESIEIEEDGANVTVIFTADGMMDDSVKAQQHVVSIFLPAAVPAGVTGYGVRYKCWRGEAADAWTTELCP